MYFCQLYINFFSSFICFILICFDGKYTEKKTLTLHKIRLIVFYFFKNNLYQFEWWYFWKVDGFFFKHLEQKRVKNFAENYKVVKYLCKVFNNIVFAKFFGEEIMTNLK